MFVDLGMKSLISAHQKYSHTWVGIQWKKDYWEMMINFLNTNYIL